MSRLGVERNVSWRVSGASLCLLVSFAMLAQPTGDVRASDSEAASSELETQKGTTKKKSPPDLSWMETVTRAGAGDAAEMRSMQLAYRLSWNGVVKAGETEMTLEVGKDGILRGDASGHSAGLARLLWRYDYALQSEATLSPLKPLRLTHVQVEREDRVRHEIAFGADRSAITTRRHDKGEKPKTSEWNFRYGKVDDLLSGMLYLRSLDYTQGEKIVLVIQPFDRPYLVTFTPEGQEKRTVGGQELETWRFDIGIRRIRKDRGVEPFEKMTRATLWISDDDYRIPIELQADLFIGYAAATLTKRRFVDAVREVGEGSGSQQTTDRAATVGGDSAVAGEERRANPVSHLGRGLKAIGAGIGRLIPGAGQASLSHEEEADD